MSAREQRDFVVFGFGSTHDALAGESLLKDMGVAVVPVPPPQALEALCGIALRVVPEDAGRVEELLANAGLAWTGRADVRDV